jgi:hypothetical protein
MAAGHSASEAEALADRCPGWQQAPSAAIDVFALASARLYDEIARNDPQPFKQGLALVTGVWFRHRLDAGIIPATRKLACPHPTVDGWSWLLEETLLRSGRTAVFEALGDPYLDD